LKGNQSRRIAGRSRTGYPNRSSASSELLALAYRGAPPAAGPTDTEDGNLQARKLTFAASEGRAQTRNPNTIEPPVSPYQVMAGTVIPASLITGINSDLPGVVIAQVTQPVFDTVSGAFLLIPQGARLIGRYQSEVSFGQDRALVTWDRIIYPDGASIRISEPGTDASGAAGLSGQTDHHWDRVFAAAGLATLLGIGAEFGQAGESDLERAVRDGFGDSVSRTGQQVVDRNLGIQPTIRVAPGAPVRVLVTRDIVLRRYGWSEQ
jgi:type IV secretion system protein TrbI